mmetsp:Transcript_22791/g.53891  ORF Transcript_22791/g.53891 Transcript_22791/m.53891 type:complete len:230 (+) Transcript_22791:1114-1803(+)
MLSLQGAAAQMRRQPPVWDVLEPGPCLTLCLRRTPTERPAALLRAALSRGDHAHAFARTPDRVPRRPHQRGLVCAAAAGRGQPVATEHGAALQRTSPGRRALLADPAAHDAQAQRRDAPDLQHRRQRVRLQDAPAQTAHRVDQVVAELAALRHDDAAHRLPRRRHPGRRCQPLLDRPRWAAQGRVCEPCVKRRTEPPDLGAPAVLQARVQLDALHAVATRPCKRPDRAL